ncbi:MAG: hypothetical protein M3Q71_04125 [Chloroflexota bacterium]|nr:hypothetical protein [Chloroflexota bacterium]
MSLNDRYNCGGSGRLENLDNHLTQLGDRAGNAWLNRGGGSRTVLTQGLYLFSIWAGLQHVALFHNPMILMIVGLALFGLLGVTQSSGGVVEQMQVEVLGLPKSTFAFLRILLLGAGLFSLATAMGYVLVAVQTGTALPMAAAMSLLHGCTLVALQAGEYIRRTNPSFPSSGLRRRA